jgi:hypothetical protein
MMKLLLGLAIIVTIFKVISSEHLRSQDQRGWESICSILSCKPVLEFCIRNNCLGKDDCRNCVISENPICVRCVDGLLDEQYFTINGAQTILCDPVNNLHQTTCNFYCRMKETITWKCEQIGGYPLCNCESELISTTTITTPLLTTTATQISATTAALTTTTTTATTTGIPPIATATTITTTSTTVETTTNRLPLGSLISNSYKFHYVLIFEYLQGSSI